MEQVIDLESQVVARN